MSDEELIEGCIREDRSFQGLLYEKYADVMFGICMRYSNTREEAEDVLQEAFIKIFDKISRFRGDGSFEGWMKRIMVNTALSSKDKRILKYETSDIEDGPEPSMDAGAIHSMSQREIIEVINSLPEGYRVVFNLFAIEGYPHKEIARMLDISESTSRSQYARARKQLMKMIGKVYTD